MSLDPHIFNTFYYIYLTVERKLFIVYVCISLSHFILHSITCFFHLSGRPLSVAWALPRFRYDEKQSVETVDRKRADSVNSDNSEVIFKSEFIVMSVFDVMTITDLKNRFFPLLWLFWSQVKCF